MILLVLVPFLVLCFALILLGIFTKKAIFKYILGAILACILILIAISFFFNQFSNENGIKRSKIYGHYIIDRSKFSGKQSNWQYEHYRFEITKEDKLIFKETKGEKIIKEDTFDIEFTDQFLSDRIKFVSKSERHHIIRQNPTLYRSTWSFYYVFHSSKFGNVFFTKGKWKPLN